MCVDIYTSTHINIGGSDNSSLQKMGGAQQLVFYVLTGDANTTI